MEKKSGILLVLIIPILLYYLASVMLSNNGQFVNHYFYPSSSVNSSKEMKIYITKIPYDSLIIKGGDEFKDTVRTEFDFWLDESKVEKSFGLFGIGS